MIKLRPYQQHAINELYRWLREYPKGNPCVVLPTGAGKSIVIGKICAQIAENRPNMRVLMLTHRKELIGQNAEKLQALLPDLNIGIYSAGMGQKNAQPNVVFAGIQTARANPDDLGVIDLVIIDEAHMVNSQRKGGYRKLLEQLQAKAPHMRVIGFTATPYRLGNGYIVDGEQALFTSPLIEPVSIAELIEQRYLCKLTSKLTDEQLDVSGVRKQGGDFVGKELEAAVDNEEVNARVASEIVRLGHDRDTWLIFCAGKQHAHHMMENLQNEGVDTRVLLGDTPKTERSDLLDDYRSKRFKALVNVDVATTGVDVPNIDLIAMLRPTESLTLYMQMVGRGMRLHPDKSDCLVLDFAGVIARHGGILTAQPDAKTQGCPICPKCSTYLVYDANTCEACGYVVPPPEQSDEDASEGGEVRERRPPQLQLEWDVDIMANDLTRMELNGWRWERHYSQKSKSYSLKCIYQPAYAGSMPVLEWFSVYNQSGVRHAAKASLREIARRSGVKLPRIPEPDKADEALLETLANEFNKAPAPSVIEYRRQGQRNFPRILSREWPKPTPPISANERSTTNGTAASTTAAVAT